MIMVVSYRRFGTAHRSHLEGPSSPRNSSKMIPIGCPETSVRNYHPKLHKIPKSQIYITPRRKPEITHTWKLCAVKMLVNESACVQSAR